MTIDERISRVCDEAAMRREARRLADLLRPGDCLALSGPLGAGKTTLVRAVAEHLGMDPAEVSSPTFTICQEYDGGRVPLSHLDAYRLSGPDELETIGWAEMLDAGERAVIIEWADRITEALPADRLDITLDHVDEQHRRMTIECRSRRWADRMHDETRDQVRDPMHDQTHDQTHD